MQFGLSRHNVPNSKVHEASMGPIWGRQDPGGPHIGPMNFPIWGTLTAQLVCGVSMGTQRWSSDGRIPNITLHLDKLIKTDYF